MPFVKPKNRLYHYCKLSTAIELILPDFKLLLSPLVYTNDPKENQSFNFNHIDIIEGEEKDIVKLNKQYSKIIRDNCKVLCFSEDYFEEKQWGCLLSNMWAHYGDNHRGICLELDKEVFINENKTLFDFKFLKPVKYVNFKERNNIRCNIDHSRLRKVGVNNYLKNEFRNECAKYLFFTKNLEWASEKETRLIHFSVKKGNEYCSIKDSLRNIILGIDFPGQYLPSINKLT